jgi:general stress protein 26
MQTEFPGSGSYEASHETLWEIIKDCRFAMLTTHEEDGSLRSRPMTTVQREFGGTLWFFAPSNSDAVQDIEQDERVCVAYANPEKNDFVSVTGTGAVVDSVAIKETLWSPMVQAWFPQGPTSSEVALIKVDADAAEYWNAMGNKLTQALSMTSAYVRGVTPKDMGVHRDMKF